MKTRSSSDLTTDITMTDLFCGGGGSSSGGKAAGVRVRIAANHWDLAIATHNSNHPEADHDQADISSTNPRRYPSTTILWASPECTNHSQAKGIPRKQKAQQTDLFADDREPLPDAAAERSRATMWDVPRFAEAHRYRYIVVENVVDAKHWLLYDAWLSTMKALDYEHQEVYLNSMHAASAHDAPAPQSRDRMYVVFWQRGERAPDLRLRPAAWCYSCDRQVDAVQEWKKLHHTGGRYRAQYIYRCSSCPAKVEPFVLPAAAAIDWSSPGERIGDRTKPLATKTLARIEAGLRRYARPLVLEAAGNTYDAADPRHAQHGQPGGYMRAWPADEEPLRTLHNTASKAVTVPPLLVPAGGTWNDEARPVLVPMRARTTRDTEGVVVPPFIAELRGGGSVARPCSEPLSTMTASGTHHALITRHNSSKGPGAEMSTPIGEPLRTLTTAGHQSLLQWHATYGYDTGLLQSLARPMPTQTTVQGDGLLSGHGLPSVEDCLFRMLEPREIALGMAFAPGYILLGNKREQVRLCGNAVTPPAAALLLGRVVAALTGDAAA